MDWYLQALKKYAVFKGRARRKEYWMFLLVNTIISFFIGIIGGVAGIQEILGSLYTLAVIIPGTAVAIRRLHDTGRSGWWQFLVIVPILGWILLLIWLVKDSDEGHNKYGPNPKEIPVLADTNTDTNV